MAINGDKYSQISIDEKLDLAAIQASINYPSEYGGTIIDSDVAHNNKLDIALSGNQVRHLNLYAIESSLNISENQVTSSLINHDTSYKLQKGWYRHLYLYKELKNEDGTPHIPKDENEDIIPYTTGPLLASQVLSNALNANNCGLSLVWDAPNYFVTNIRHRSQMYDTNLTGLINELISPLQFTERYAIYTYVRDTILYVKKMHSSGSGGVPEYDIADIYSGTISIKKEIILKPKVRKVIIEYYEFKTPDLTPVIDTTTERTYDSNGALIGIVINKSTTIREVVTTETEEVFRTLVSAYTGNQSGATLYPISKSETDYTYDILPTELDSDGLFQPYRNLVYKNTEAIQYVFPDLSKDQFKRTVANIAYGYNTSKELVSEVETTDYYNNLDEFVKTTKSVTTHTQCTADTVEIKRTDYQNDEMQGSVSTIRGGKLQESARVPENDADSSNWDLKHMKVEGNGDMDDRVEKISSDVLSLTQLIQAAHEIIRDGSCVKVVLDFNLIPLVWLTKGTQIKLIGTVSGVWYDEEGNSYNTTIDLADITDTSFIIESQQINIDGESMTGNMSLVGYKYYSSTGGGFESA